MANIVIPDNPSYSEVVPIIETTDPVHADIVNPVFKRLLINEAYLNRKIMELQKRIDKAASDNIWGGTNLSSAATIGDSAAQYTVIRKTSSAIQEQSLFSVPVSGIRKGLYSLLIRLKASQNTDGNGLVGLKVSSGGVMQKQRTIIAQMFKSANTYQTFGMNVELDDSATISAALLKNSANITISIDYVILQSAQTAITSL